MDAVVIATPVNTHYRLAKEALLYDKHVLIEKPITATSREASELLERLKEIEDSFKDHKAELNKNVSSEIKKLKSEIELLKNMLNNLNKRKWYELLGTKLISCQKIQAIDKLLKSELR